MHPQGFKPLFDTLKTPSNMVFIALAVLLAVDYVIGSPLMTQVVLIQLRIQKIDPASDHIKIFTIFGTFTDMNTWRSLIERVLIGIFAVIPGLSILRALYSSISGK